MAKKVFISYRRTDKVYATALYEKLLPWLGEENIFRDRENLQAGYPFKEQLRMALEQSDAVLVVITKHWEAEIEKRKGHTDYMLWEIEKAFSFQDGRSRQIIPVVFDRGMPEMQPYLEYPHGKALEKLKANEQIKIEDEHKEAGYDKLIKDLQKKYVLLGGNPDNSPTEKHLLLDRKVFEQDVRDIAKAVTKKKRKQPAIIMFEAEPRDAPWNAVKLAAQKVRKTLQEQLLPKILTVDTFFLDNLDAPLNAFYSHLADSDDFEGYSPQEETLREFVENQPFRKQVIFIHIPVEVSQWNKSIKALFNKLFTDFFAFETPDKPWFVFFSFTIKPPKRKKISLRQPKPFSVKLLCNELNLTQGNHQYRIKIMPEKLPQVDADDVERFYQEQGIEGVENFIPYDGTKWPISKAYQHLKPKINKYYSKQYQNQ